MNPDEPIYKFRFTGRAVSRDLKLGFDCAISKSSEQSILKKLKDLRIHRRSTSTLEQIARLLNPMIRGWINYYGRFRRRNLDRIINALNHRLMKWVKLKIPMHWGIVTKFLR